MERQERQNTTPNQRDEDQPPSEDELADLARAWAEAQVESADDVFNQLVHLLQEQQQRSEGSDKEGEEEPQLDLGLVALINRANQVWDDLNHGGSDPPAPATVSEGESELAKMVASKLLRKHARLHEALRALMSSTTSALSAVDEANKLHQHQAMQEKDEARFVKASFFAANEAAINSQA